MVEGSVCALYCPIVSIVRPSRGERRSATTIRQIGFFLEPTLLSLIRTAMKTREVTDGPPFAIRHSPSERRGAGGGCLPAQLLHELGGVGHLARGHPLH